MNMNNLKKIASNINITEELAAVAMKVSSILKRNNIPFAIIGGIAVGAHTNQPRTTKDVDFVVPEEALDQIEVLFGRGTPLALNTEESGVSVLVDGIEVDFIGTGLKFHFNSTKVYNELTVPSVFSVLFMKLRAGRVKDSADIVEIIKNMTAEQRKEFRIFLKKVNKEYEFDYETLKEDFDSLGNIADLEQQRSKKASQEYRIFTMTKLLKK